MSIRKNFGSNLFNIFLLVAGIALFCSAQTIKAGVVLGQGADFMPKLMSVTWIVLSVLNLLYGFREQDEGKKENGSVKRFLMTLVLLFVYIYLLNPIGFTLASIFYVFIQELLFVPREKRNTKNYVLFAVISIVIPIAVNLLFQNAFSLILPKGRIFQ